jgi:phosphoenolpyruvate synthase/pyruvate phosphate dikinase
MEIIDLFSKEVPESVGKKGYNLGILARNNLLVPGGFIITQDFYSQFLEGIYEQVYSYLRIKDPKESSDEIKRIILENELNQDLNNKINESMNKFSNETRYAVRSSGNCNLFGKTIKEDSAEKSLAGQFESYLNVSKENMCDALRLCWASLFNERSLKLFQSSKNLDYIRSGISVVVQEMISADKSFVVMTKDPFEINNLGIEATYGPCEAIVSGNVTGDMYLCDRKNGEVTEIEIGEKGKRIKYNDFRLKDNFSYEDTPLNLRIEQCLNDSEVKNIFKVSMNIEKIFNRPMDIEGVIKDNEIYVVQARPITTLGGK